jgi:hypothetical protein
LTRGFKELLTLGFREELTRGLILELTLGFRELLTRGLIELLTVGLMELFTTGFRDDGIILSLPASGDIGGGISIIWHDMDTHRSDRST